MDWLHLDVLGPFPESKSVNRYILVIIDLFTQTRSWDNRKVVGVWLFFFFDISCFGVPLEIHTGQGWNFEISLLIKVCWLLNVTKTWTTSYHPALNGQVDRFKRTLLQMIRCYVHHRQQNWDEHLPLLTVAYRSTVHSATGFTTNQLMLW